MLKGNKEDIARALLAGGHFALARQFVTDVPLAPFVNFVTGLRLLTPLHGTG